MKAGISIPPDLTIPYQIELQDVSFHYPKSRRNILSHINLTIRAGEKLAVVGLNGAGKTTLIKLICGFLDPPEGKVLLNNVDIRAFNRQDYYRLFSAVFQNFSILDVTIAENITQGDENFDKDLMKQCIEKAGLTKRIESLPQGIETHIGKVFKDGIDLSGGEMQRLMLARALYKNAPIIILDEPTAALDPIAEAEVYSNMNRIIGNKSAIFISHRLSSCRFCDIILVFHEGKLVQYGNHDILLNDTSGMYYQLWNAQAQYYKK